MITQGPFDLALDTVLPLDDPGATSNNPATAVQIQNASGFVIEVNAGGILLTIQSFAAQTVPTSGGGQHMSVKPISANNPGQTTDPTSLTVVWLLAGETAPMLDGPLTAAAIAQGLANAGIAGASVLTDFLPIAAGVSAPFAGLATGTYRVWNWGYSKPALGTNPTVGDVVFGITNGVDSAIDALDHSERASNRLAGLVFDVNLPTDFAGITNNLDQTTKAFLTYSAA